MSARHHIDVSWYVGPTSAFQSDRRRTAPFLQQVSTSALCRLLISGRDLSDICPTLVKHQNDIGFTSGRHRILAIYSFLFIVSIYSNRTNAINRERRPCIIPAFFLWWSRSSLQMIIKLFIVRIYVLRQRHNRYRKIIFLPMLFYSKSRQSSDQCPNGHNVN